MYHTVKPDPRAKAKAPFISAPQASMGRLILNGSFIRRVIPILYQIACMSEEIFRVLQECDVAMW